MSGEEKKTGIFYVREPAGIVVMQRGKVVHHYKNVGELVEAHVKGVAALEREMEDTLARHYRPD
ncbi:MAG: hypothetical protein ACFHX7_21840 [Pseudomonadota bacterium]